MVGSIFRTFQYFRLNVPLSGRGVGVGEEEGFGANVNSSLSCPRDTIRGESTRPPPVGGSGEKSLC